MTNERTPLVVNDLVRRAHSTARAKGWYDPPKTVGEALLLMHSELSEATEELRVVDPAFLNRVRFDSAGKPIGFPIELADCVIRIADLCAALGIDLEAALLTKMDYNDTRPHRHGNKAY